MIKKYLVNIKSVKISAVDFDREDEDFLYAEGCEPIPKKTQDQNEYFDSFNDAYNWLLNSADKYLSHSKTLVEYWTKFVDEIISEHGLIWDQGQWDDHGEPDE